MPFNLLLLKYLAQQPRHHVMSEKLTGSAFRNVQAGKWYHINSASESGKTILTGVFDDNHVAANARGSIFHALGGETGTRTESPSRLFPFDGEAQGIIWLNEDNGDFLRGMVERLFQSSGVFISPDPDNKVREMINKRQDLAIAALSVDPAGPGSYTPPQPQEREATVVQRVRDSAPVERTQQRGATERRDLRNQAALQRSRDRHRRNNLPPQR